MQQGQTGSFEAARDGDFIAADQPLRDDVRRLGALVGQVLAEQVSPAFLQQIEAIRRSAIARRESAAPTTTLHEHLRAQSAPQADLIVRAFTSYFQAINLAERVHRIRRRRDY